jgi:hypothetical protein
MNTDIRQTVADRAKKWHQLSQLLEDREIYLFLKNRFSNGRRDSSPKLDFQPDTKNPTDDSEATAETNGIKPELRLKKGELTGAIESECKKFAVGQEFSAYDVYDRLKAENFPFASSNPSVAVALVVRKLADRGRTVKEVLKGSGKRPTKYSRIG